MGDLAARDRIAERARDVLLSDDCGEGLGAVAAIECGALRHRPMLMGYGRAPSVDRDVSNTHTRVGSDQACLRHEATTVYRCFLPDLTGFTGRFCTGPDRQRRRACAGSAMPDLGRGFSPAGADCGYRAPLAPRLARPQGWYLAIGSPMSRSCMRDDYTNGFPFIDGFRYAAITLEGDELNAEESRRPSRSRPRSRWMAPTARGPPDAVASHYASRTPASTKQPQKAVLPAAGQAVPCAGTTRRAHAFYR